MDRQMDPMKLPEPLRPFLPLFEKWGNVESDSGRYALMDRAESDPSEMQELREWAIKLKQVNLDSCREWVDGPISPLEDHYEQAKVYFTCLLLFGELGID